MDPSPPITVDDVRRAAGVLDGRIHRTPLLTSHTLDDLVGARVVLKAEHLQRAGAFKIRGATNRLLSLTPQERDRGVVAFSSGNHAQAVALAARETGTSAVIVMPVDAPPAKLAATAGYGAEVVTYDRSAGQDREVVARAIADRDGRVLVPPYDDPLVMAGQGTVALELLADAPGLDVVVVPVGGGGLVAGCATYLRSVSPGIRIVGVEPALGDDTRRSFDAGHRVRIPFPATIADGLAAETPGERTFPVLQRGVDEIVTVTDDEILDAMVFLFDRMKQVVEPSGAVGVAALLAGSLGAEARSNVGVVVSGGNVGSARFAELVGRQPSLVPERNRDPH
jgi:threonine dehydratase